MDGKSFSNLGATTAAYEDIKLTGEQKPQRIRFPSQVWCCFVREHLKLGQETQGRGLAIRHFNLLSTHNPTQSNERANPISI